MMWAFNGRNVRNISDDILVFAEDYGSIHKQFLFVVTSLEALRERLYNERIRYWHGFMPSTQSILYRGKHNEVLIKNADAVYVASLFTALPDSLVRLYFK